MATDYNAATWTASELLADVYSACRMPDTGTVDYTPSVVLRYATDAIWNFAGHAVAGARNGRLATTILRPVTTSSITTSGQDYELPPMAVADTIDGVSWVNASENLATPLQVVPIGLEETYFSPADTGRPTHFALLDGVLRVYPKPSESGTLRITYQRRHGHLVIGSDTALLSFITDNSGYARLELTSTPSSFVPGAWVDIVSASYPYRIKVHGAVLVVAHGSSQFTTSIPYDEAAAAQLGSDTVTIYGKTPYVHLPLELRGSLTEHIASRIAGEVGDESLANRKDRSAEIAMGRAKQMLSPRTKATREKAFNPRSLVRNSMRNLKRWGD